MVILKAREPSPNYDAIGSEARWDLQLAQRWIVHGSVFASTGLSQPAYLAFTNDAGRPLSVPPIAEPLAWTMALSGASLTLPSIDCFDKNGTANAVMR